MLFFFEIKLLFNQKLSLINALFRESFTIKISIIIARCASAFRFFNQSLLYLVELYLRICYFSFVRRIVNINVIKVAL